MLDGLGMAETTPGPLIMVVQFVGFLGAFGSRFALAAVRRSLGGLLATWVTFVPSFLFIFLGAPFIEVLRDNRALRGAFRPSPLRSSAPRSEVCSAPCPDQN